MNGLRPYTLKKFWFRSRSSRVVKMGRNPRANPVWSIKIMGWAIKIWAHIKVGRIDLTYITRGLTEFEPGWILVGSLPYS